MGKDFKTLIREQGEKLRADSLLSTEKGGLAVEQVKGDHVVVGTSGIRDDGIPFVQVAPQPASERPPLVGPGQGFRGPASIHEGLVREAEERQRRHDEAAALVVPGVWYFRPRPVCAAFQGQDGNYAPTGCATWCDGKACPCWSEPNICAESKLSFRSMLVKKVQPATREEFEHLIVEEGAVIAADHEQRVKDKMAELAGVRETEARHAREAVVARDLEIMRLRAEDRRKPKFTAVDSPRDMHDKLAAAKAAVGGR